MSEIEIKDGYVIDMGEDTLMKGVARALAVHQFGSPDSWEDQIPMARVAISAMVDWKIENKPRIIADSEFSHVERCG